MRSPGRQASTRDLLPGGDIRRYEPAVHHVDDGVHAGQVNQIVGDEERGRVEFIGQPNDELDDAGSAFLVERACGFVDEEHAGVVHEGAGDIDPLTLPSGELVRAFVPVAGQSDGVEHV